MTDDVIKLQTKTCAYCGEERPANQFYGLPSAEDGLSTFCKPCFANYGTEIGNRLHNATWADSRGQSIDKAEWEADMAERAAQGDEQAATWLKAATPPTQRYVWIGPGEPEEPEDD